MSLAAEGLRQHAGALLRAGVTLAAVSLLQGARAAAQDAPSWRILPSSRFEIRTTSEGVFGFAGDDHLIRAGTVEGRVRFEPSDPSASTVELTVPADSLRVLSPVGEDDRRKIRQRMREDVLRTAEHPEIRFRSTGVEGLGGDSLRVTGALTVAGNTREVAVELGTHRGGDTLRVFGSFGARLTDLGIEPPAVALGTVRVSDAVRFVVDAALVRDEDPGRPQPPSPPE